MEATEKVAEELPPFLVKNESGLHIQLKLGDTYKVVMNICRETATGSQLHDEYLQQM